MLAIRLEGQEILGHPDDLSRPYGLFVQPKGFQGWQGLPAGRREALARAVQHGEHDTPVFLPARGVTIDGWAIAPNEFELGRVTDAFVGIGGPGKRMEVAVDLHGAVTTAIGRRILAECDDTGIRSGNHLRAEFQLQLLCADPRKYGATAVLPGDRLTPANPAATATSIEVGHYGNFPAYPVIEIPSAPAAWTVTSPGGTFTVSGATAGGTHVVDLRNGRVYRNGVEMPGVGRGDLWAVPDHTSWTHTLSAAGRVRITDTFI